MKNQIGVNNRLQLIYSVAVTLVNVHDFHLVPEPVPGRWV